MNILQEEQEAFEKEFDKEHFQYDGNLEYDLYEDTKSFLLASHKRVLMGMVKEIKDWEYQYTNYVTQMTTKSAFERGNMARELSSDIQAIISNLINEK